MINKVLPEAPAPSDGTETVAANALPLAGATVHPESGKRNAAATAQHLRAANPARSEVLLKITSAIANAVTADRVFEALVDHVAEAIGASSGGLWILGPDGKSARLARARGYSDEALRYMAVVRADDTPAIPVLESLRSGEPVWIASQAELVARYPHLAPIVTPGRDYRISCLPLKAQERVLGVLALTIEAQEPASEDERDFLLLVASYAGQALERVRLFEAERASRAAADTAANRLALTATENARLYQETLDARTRAEQLYRFAQAVVAADRVEVVFEAALSAIQAALGATRAAVLTFDGEGVVRFRAWRNLSDTYRAAVEGHSPWRPDAHAPEPLTFDDATAAAPLASFHELFRQEGIGALAFIPLATSGRLLGKFVVYYDRPHAFSGHELETARAIANHLASVTTRFAVLTKLEETVRQNELFAGVLAHDLRSPLSAILTSAQLALMRQEGAGAGSKRDPKPLSRIISSGQRMTAMIEQLLDFTRVRSGGGIEIHAAPADLGALCGQAIEEVELARPECQLDRCLIGDPLGTWDPDRLLQVLSNLIGNASQHGDPGGVVSIKVDGSERDHVTVSVHNLGAIPESLLPHLFDAFRITRHRRERSRGLGLGLYIVSEIARAHGGSVAVESSQAAGTTFTVRLPRHAVQRERAPVTGST